MKIKQLLFFLLVALSAHVFAQKTIYGKVIDENKKPIIGATIYLNNTSYWTTSNEKGEFEIIVYNGYYNLIVTYLGYESLLHKINSNSYNKRLVFTMTERVNRLNEVVVKAKIPKKKYIRFMQEFKNAFLGTSKFGRNCTILNEEVLNFSYDEKKGLLKVTASEPLKIKNRNLGYLINYDLTFFEKRIKSIKYLGYSRFQELNTNFENIRRKWKVNREIAYKGSLMHFLQSLLKNNHFEEGFRVDYHKLMKNPERPSDSILMTTAAFLENLYSPLTGESVFVTGLNYNLDSINKGKRRLITKNQSDFITKKDSALAIINKARLPKTLVKRLINAKKEEFTFEKDRMLYLNFYPYIKVKYAREEEAEEYPLRNPNWSYQISKIQLTTNNSPIDSFGNIIDPLTVVTYDYMGFEKFGDTVPLNYRMRN